MECRWRRDGGGGLDGGSGGGALVADRLEAGKEEDVSSDADIKSCICCRVG